MEKAFPGNNIGQVYEYCGGKLFWLFENLNNN